MATATFFGQRPMEMFLGAKAAYNRDNYKVLNQQIREAVGLLISKGIDTFITNGAQGTNQLVFWAVHHAKMNGAQIKNILYIPFKEQADVWEEDCAFGKKDYAKMLKAADEIHVISEDVDLKDYKAKRNALYACNNAMIESADIVIGIAPNLKKGHISNYISAAMNEALQKGKFVRTIVPKTKEMVVTEEVEAISIDSDVEAQLDAVVEEMAV